MAVRNAGQKNFTYTVGDNSWTQSDLSNRMPGTDANAIYYATHGGTGAATPQSGSGVTATTVKKPTNTGSKSSGSGSSNSSSDLGFSYSASTGSGNAGADYAAMIQSMIDQQRAAAQAAYDASRARLDEAWGNTKGSLDKNLQSTLGSLQRNYDYGAGVAKKDANDSLRQAYINYMLNRRDLGTQLSAMGLSGGATESSLAKLLNEYGSSRNGIKETLNNNLAQLLNTYQNNTASAEQLYNQQYADAMNNYIGQLNSLEQMLANNMMGSYSGSSLSSLASYAKTLADLQNNMASAAEGYTPTQNTLDLNLVNTTQGSDQGSVTDYAKYLAMAQNLANQGQSAPNIIQQLAASGVPKDIVYKLMGAA
jgi:hypothetical protein